MTWRRHIGSGLIAVFALCFVALGLHPLFHREPAQPAPPPETGKRIAITFDDVPRGGGAFVLPRERPAILVKALRRGGIEQAAFFVNPGRIGGSQAHLAAIRAYTDAGHVLANHTANHVALSQVSAANFLADVDAAEAWLKQQPGYRPWLRFPQLDEGGKDMAKRDAVRAGLQARGIRNGYVTIDASDWNIEGLAIAAAKSGRSMDRAALRNLYIEQHLASADLSDRMARRTLGIPPVQVLLLHETDLAALWVDDLAAALRKDGWTIVTADEAYADPFASLAPESPIASGNRLQMVAWEMGDTGERWFAGNDPEQAKKLFAERVLRQ